MHALFIILNDIFLIEEIHNILLASGVGGTILDSHGLGDVEMNYSSTHSTFGSLRNITNNKLPENRTIISVIKDDDKLDEVTTEVLKVLNNIENSGIGFMFVMPVELIFGYKGKDIK